TGFFGHAREPRVPSRTCVIGPNCTAPCCSDHLRRVVSGSKARMRFPMLRPGSLALPPPSVQSRQTSSLSANRPTGHWWRRLSVERLLTDDVLRAQLVELVIG